jgi:hypothetical protein
MRTLQQTKAVDSAQKQKLQQRITEQRDIEHKKVCNVFHALIFQCPAIM